MGLVALHTHLCSGATDSPRTPTALHPGASTNISISTSRDRDLDRVLGKGPARDRLGTMAMGRTLCRGSHTP